jgi:diphthamide biosynthesis enzyme Dph1/Dph2-like protein
MNYNLELNKVIEKIKEKNSERVLIQLADGLKPEAKNIADAIKKETRAEILIYSGSCYGGCDIPLGLKQLNIDLLIQFGHNQFIKEW